MNIEVAIKEAYQELKNNQIESALLDSEILLSTVIKKDRKYILLNLDKELDQNDQDNFKNLILKRSRGKPLAYLTGTKSFWKHDFLCNCGCPHSFQNTGREKLKNFYKEFISKTLYVGNNFKPP